MRILLLSFYFPPDLSAGSFRAQALVDALRRQGGGDLRADVITTMPNRYSSFSHAAEEHEETGGISVQRIRVPAHDSGMAQQMRTFRVFASQVLARTRHGSWDVVVATSSRLMTAALGALVARRTGAPLYLDIRDIFTDTMSDLLRPALGTALLPSLRVIERRTIRRAARVNLVSAGFRPYFTRVDPTKSYRVFTNGIDEEFLERDFRGGSAGGALPVILYAGNLGEGQGLHRIVPEVARRLEGRARIRIIGDGGRRPQLEQALAAAGVGNVELLPPVGRAELCVYYRDADILFLHLNQHAAFEKVLPSKLFEYAATGKPILGGLSGYPAEFLREHVTGAEVFSPCNADAMVTAFERLKDVSSPVERNEFRTQFARVRIMDEWARDILSFGSGPI